MKIILFLPEKNICSPGAYVQGKGELSNLTVYFTQLEENGAYIIINRFIYDTYLT